MPFIQNFSLQFYVCTFIMRALWSLTIVVLSSIGFQVINDDLLGNRVNIKQNNKNFEKLYFGLAIAIESLQMIACLWLFCRQRGRKELREVIQNDNQSSCGFLVMRILAPVGMGVIGLSGIHIKGRGNALRSIGGQKQREWDAIYSFTVAIVGMEIMAILWFAYSMLNQPLHTQREIRFDGVITEMNALEQLQLKHQQKRDNQMRLEEVRQKQKAKIEAVAMKHNHFAFQRGTGDFIRNFKDVDKFKDGHNPDFDPYTQYKAQKIRQESASYDQGADVLLDNQLHMNDDQRLSTPTLESGSPTFKPGSIAPETVGENKGSGKFKRNSDNIRKSDGLIYRKQGQTESEDALQLAEQPESSDFVAAQELADISERRKQKPYRADAIFDDPTPEGENITPETQNRKIKYQNTNDQLLFDGEEADVEEGAEQQ